MTPPVPVVVAAGSNLGDRMRFLEEGIRAVRSLITVTAVSPVVEGPPEGGAAQPPYLNLVLLGRTRLDPETLLSGLLRIEAEAGRVRTTPGGARTLDLDLIFQGDLVRSHPDPILPHPRWARRPFVVGPLAAIAPDWVDPSTGRTVAQVAEELGLPLAGQGSLGEASGDPEFSGVR